MSNQPVPHETGNEPDRQGKAPAKGKFVNRGDTGYSGHRLPEANEQSDVRDQAIRLLDSDQSAAPFPNRGPHLAPGTRSEKGSRDRSEIFSNNMTASLPGGDQGQADKVPEIPIVRSEKYYDSSHQQELRDAQEGFSPNPHRLQTKKNQVDDRFGKGQVQADLD